MVYDRVDQRKGGGLTDEEKVIALLKAGDPNGAEQFLQQYRPLLCYLIAPILQDRQDQEDCLSEVVMRVWENIHRYDAEKGSFTTWLTVLTRNAARNKCRQNQKRQENPIDDETPSVLPGPEEALLRAERQKALADALCQLSGKDRLLFYRKYYYCQSTAHIAAELGLSLRAVEGRLYRIRKQLRDLLGGDAYA